MENKDKVVWLDELFSYLEENGIDTSKIKVEDDVEEVPYEVELKDFIETLKLNGVDVSKITFK